MQRLLLVLAYTDTLPDADHRGRRRIVRICRCRRARPRRMGGPPCRAGAFGPDNRRTLLFEGRLGPVAHPRLFVGEQVMEQVTAALPKRGATVAAIAYVTRDLLKLKHGDALAVNASVSAVRAGATDPSLLLELLSSDVIVVNQPALHAKAVVRGNTVAIGSANLSARTANLQELMWLTRDPLLLGRVTKWLQELIAPAPMQPSELQKLVPLYRRDAQDPVKHEKRLPGHEPSDTDAATPNPFNPATVPRLWLWVGNLGGTASPTESTLAAHPDPALTGKKWVLNRDLKRTHTNDVWIRYRRRQLEPPRRVVKARSSSTTADGVRWTLLGYRAQDRSVALPDWVFDKYVQRLGEDDLTVDAEDIPRLLSLWP